MRLVPPFSRMALLGFALACLGILSACKGKSSSSEAPAGTISVTGKVTFLRVPLVKDANGVPLGLDTNPANFTTLPARGVPIRFYKSMQETNPDGTKTTVWKVANFSAVTDADGNYAAYIDKDVPVFVELVSQLGTSVRLVADRMNSSLNQADRPMYLLRKGLDGSSSDTNPTPGASASANVVVNFTVGVDDKWWLGVPNPLLATSAVRETQGTGSRVLGILDSIYSFQKVYGRVLPGAGSGDVLDLHYRPGINETAGSYVEYDRTLFPQSFDSSTLSRHFFGSLQGGPANDDAWDEAVIFTLLGRNYQAYAWASALKPVGQCLPHLAPDLALVEGFARGMAANLLKSPYLADTAGAGATVLDIRDRSGLGPDQISHASGPNLAALCWDLILAGNSIAAPGTAATWSNINSSAMIRFFVYALPRNADNTQAVDIISIYGQLKRLQEGQATGEPVNLQGIFTDAVLTAKVAPFGITWPRPTSGPLASFLVSWGTDPNSQTTALPAVSLSMATAARVQGTFPNASENEVAYAQFLLTKDTAFNVNLTTQPASLPAGVAVEVHFPGIARTLTFTGPTSPTRLIFVGNSTAPVTQFVRIRTLSPNLQAPDIQATVQLVPAS